MAKRKPPAPAADVPKSQVEYLRMSLDDLHEDPANSRKHSPENLSAIRASLRTFQQVEPLVVQRSTGKVIGGNGRLITMRELGWTEADVALVDCDNATAAMLSITLNRSGELAEWDKDALDALLRTVQTDDQELADMLAALAEQEGVVPGDREAMPGGSAETVAEEEIEPGYKPEDGLDLLFKSPYPWFGGKARIAKLVWQRFGNVRSYVEPFFGSGAVMLNRPQPFEGIETVNDFDAMVCNFWRAVQEEPEQVAEYADWPVLEPDLHARHAWLVARKDSLQAQLEGDPDHFDAKIAGWWVWGMACWIGSGFCSGNGPWQVVEAEDGSRQLVHLGTAGQGVNRQLVHLGTAGQGVNRKRVSESEDGRAGLGERGLLAWMQALSERFRRVRVCCGDWTRVCGGDNGDALRHMIQQTPCGVFLDPPYADTADRESNLYRKDSESVAHAVREWAIRHGEDERFRIALCGYDGEHQMPASWACVAWKAVGGYGLQGDGAGRENAKRERIWFSPHCLRV